MEFTWYYQLLILRGIFIKSNLNSLHVDPFDEFAYCKSTCRGVAKEVTGSS